MRASTSASAPECALAELVGSLGPNAKKWRGRNGEDSGATKDSDDLAHARARGEPDSATPKGESSSCSCATHALWPPAIKVVVVVGGGDLTGVISIAQAFPDARGT